MSLGKRNLQPSLGHSVDGLVKPGHPYRRLLETVDFEALCLPLQSSYSDMGRRAYPLGAMLKAAVLQYMEDRSDRQMERFLAENLAGKLFCGFELEDETPDHSAFGEWRRRVGAERLAEVFNRLGQALRGAGLIREVFTFVDATKLVSKENLWKERDLAEERGQRLGNSNVAELAADPEARFGSKGGTRWYGYKAHVSVDMSQGLVARALVTPANVEDARAAPALMPSQGMVFGDKAYAVGDSARAMAERGLCSGCVLRKDMKGKNADKDRWLSSVRMPFEGTFARFGKRARYRGLAKCRFQVLMQCLCHNLKRLLAIRAEPLEFGPECA
jgi:IS5 family transposase